MITWQQEDMVDPFNYNGKRNMANTPKSTYNCAGYAFGTYSWYMMGHDDEEHDLIMEHADSGDYEVALKLASQAIMDELPGWELVGLEAVMERVYSPDKYEIVAMRFCDFDYHFWKLGRNWNWYDKMGSAGWIDRHAFTEVLARRWNYRYDSPIVCFIRTR